MGNSRAIRDVDEADLLQTIKVNVLGPLVLFQATDHLLRKADQMGKFVVITSAQGSIADMSPGRSGSYGISKAAVNALTVKLQEETPDLVVFGLE
jgi:norsolorinic acid ketoreductase